MPRRVLPVALAAGLVASVALSPACRPASCTLLGCDPVHARITAHVSVPLAELVAATTTVCWREVCSDLAASRDGGAGGELAFDASTSSLVGEVTVSSEDASASLLHVELRFFTRARSGDFVYTRQANGDLYRVTVVDGSGKRLFEAEQLATYEELYPNGSDCDPEPCRRTTIELRGP